MKKYLLDSNIVSEPTKPVPNQSVLDLIERNRFSCSMCSVSYFEMLHGVLRLPDGRRKERLMAFLNEVVFPFYDFLPYDMKAARIHAEMLSKLEKSGKPVPFQDSIIAAVAIANDLVLVTRNTKDFQNIADECPLKIENWFA